MSESAVYLCEWTESCVYTPRESVMPAAMFKRTESNSPLLSSTKN